MAITPLPDPPSRANPADFAEKGDAFLGALPTFQTEANALAVDVNADAASAAAQVVLAANEVALAAEQVVLADTAREGAELAETNAADSATSAALYVAAASNNKGAWSDLTGSLSIPASVSHNGLLWVLNESLADVTLEEPSVSDSWSVITLSFILQPTITSPTNGATGYLDPFTSSAFSAGENYNGAHDYTHWQISYTSNFASIEFDSTVGNLTEWDQSLGSPLQTAYVRVRHGSDGHLSPWSTAVSFTSPNVYISAPTVTVEGSPTDVPESPTLTGSEFSVVGGSDTHASTDWQVYDGGLLVWESLADASNLLSIVVPAGQLSVSTEYTFKARYNGTTYGSSSYGEAVATTAASFIATYGLNWDETNDTYARTGDATSWSTPADFTANATVQSEMKRCVLNADGTVNYFLFPTDSTLKADGVTPSVLDGTDGNVMVQIPKFYYKYNYNTASGVVHEHTISLAPIDGGTVHPAFVQNGVEKDYRYYPAYQGSVVGGKLVSISGAYVDTNLTRAAYRAYAVANGPGWHVTDWLLYEAVVLLMITEYGTMNMQAALGEGRVRLNGGTYVDGSYYGIHGNSNSDGNFSNNNTYVGDADNAAADLSYMTYRGCENVWGNVYLFLDGININEHVVYLNDNPATFADDTTTNYTDIGVTMGAVNGYAVKLANSGKGFFPTDVTGGTDSTGTTDYYNQSTGWRSVHVGGLAGDGLGAGPLYLKSDDVSANAYVSVGAGVSF